MSHVIHGGPTVRSSSSTVFDWVETGLCWIKSGVKKNAQFFTEVVKMNF